ARDLTEPVGSDRSHRGATGGTGPGAAGGCRAALRCERRRSLEAEIAGRRGADSRQAVLDPGDDALEHPAAVADGGADLLADPGDGTAAEDAAETSAATTLGTANAATRDK